MNNDVEEEKQKVIDEMRKHIEALILMIDKSYEIMARKYDMSEQRDMLLKLYSSVGEWGTEYPQYIKDEIRKKLRQKENTNRFEGIKKAIKRDHAAWGTPQLLTKSTFKALMHLSDDVTHKLIDNKYHLAVQIPTAEELEHIGVKSGHYIVIVDCDGYVVQECRWFEGLINPPVPLVGSVQ